ncbi:hypothetical protein OOZ15_04315 [Galbibacter sp. EGI 63066]|uniref:hypothetical protein n=1 Tax=Galbibacter sp. EGI 63066 TaxID=2993559 RepID=UPI0022499F75|nr:hypothetical protein [Galbibacter sp. EGI 63066]MCX2679157.1 hypothetical protein [Galbibacter sp. EGI 63066]
MTKKHLREILSKTFGFPPLDSDFDLFYSPNYFVQTIDESFLGEMKNCLCFDYKQQGLTFVEGEISCTGISILFKSDRFEYISVCVFYDFSEQQIYNTVLAMPRYTNADWESRERIDQTACIIKSDNDLERYFNQLFKRFKCPVLSEKVYDTTNTDKEAAYKKLQHQPARKPA